MASNRSSNVPLSSLRRLMQAPARQVAAPEHCDLCQEVLAPDHRHLLELSSRTLICACTACFLLFNKDGAGSGKYRTVPRRFLAMPDFAMSDGEWDDLMIPVNMVFMYRSTGSKPVTALYPGPAGATESQLSLDNWSTLVQNNPILETLEPDVEALLIYRVRGVREYYVVPIDVCYELVGLIRRSWRGLSGVKRCGRTLQTSLAKYECRPSWSRARRESNEGKKRREEQMPELNFEITGAEIALFAAVPTLLFKLHIVNVRPQERVQSVMLRAQVQIMATQRRYSPEAKEQLLDVFGEPSRWSETLRSFLWTHANTTVPAFTEETTVDLPIVCSYDFEVVGTKYFAALEDGEIPLNFLFSGTIFYTTEAGQVQIGQVPWSKEAVYRLPVSLWQQMIQHYYPNSAWIRMNKDVFDQIYRYKTQHGLPTLEDALTRLLAASSEEVQR